ANWTFIVWGALNALYFMPLLLRNKNRVNTDTVAQNRLLPSLREIAQIGFTFSLTIVAWIFFRAENISHALSYLSTIFSKSFFSIPQFAEILIAFYTIILIVIFVIIEWIGRNEQYALAKIALDWKMPYRYALYYSIIFAIFLFMGKSQQFIYFQF
ncbi:MAG: MBOAT family protein, partial [Bacteroidales bacterium]|nr:MBOAT family protein [Bacteroidales bacterium]